MSESNGTEQATKTLPPQEGAPPPQGGEEKFLLDEYEELFDQAGALVDRAGSQAFLQAMQKGFAVQTAKEFRLNTYEFMKRIIAVGAKAADEIDQLWESVDDLKDVIEKHTRLFNDLMSTSIIAHALNLSRLCLERVQDEEIRNLAQAIYNSMHPQTIEATAAAAAAVGAAVPAQAPAPATAG